MDEPQLPPTAPGLHTVGDLDPVHGQHIEMDYTGRLVAGRYRVQRHIGSGGMADVYRARDERLCRDVALKFLKPRLASEEWCARMFQEARASAAIDHPNLLRVTDVGRVGPSIYLAMDLLQGATLEAVLRAQPLRRLPWRRAIDLLLPVLGAVSAAHERGFIHRDIKPDNLFLHRRGDEEQLIVLDLGIVKRLPAAPPESLRLPPTATGYILGTPAYMSPEQAGGAPVDARADIYSLGVTLYRLLTGRVPFTASPGEHYVVLARHLYDPPPRFAAVAEPPLDCPDSVEEVVLRALAKAPDDRWPSVQALAAALRACLAPGLEEASTPLLPKRPPMPVEPVGPVEPTPSQSVRLRGFSQLSVLMALAGALVAWRGPPADERPALRIALPDEPEIVSVPSHRLLPDEPRGHHPPLPVSLLDPPVRISPPEPPSGSSPTDPRAPDTAPDDARRRVKRALWGAQAAVRRCARLHGDADARSLAVEVTVSTAGAVTAARSLDADPSAADPCVRAVLLALRSGPGPAVKVRHSFRLAGAQ